MSDAFVDVSWRGLEVGRRIKLRAVHADNAFLDHTTPMPVGTVLSIRTDEGHEIPATVVRVHEQVGGSNEIPGMQIVPKGLAGAAKEWWTTRAEATVTAEVPAPPAAAPIDGTPVLSMAAMHAAQSDPRAEITGRPTLTMSTVEIERRAAVGASDDAAASRTEVMTAMSPDALDGVVETSASDDGLVDDGRRTMAMSAVDISAIVEAGIEAEPSGAIDDDGPSGDGPSGDSGPTGAGATSKKKRPGGKRSKRR